MREKFPWKIMRGQRAIEIDATPLGESMKRVLWAVMLDAIEWRNNKPFLEDENVIFELTYLESRRLIIINVSRPQITDKGRAWL